MAARCEYDVRVPIAVPRSSLFTTVNRRVRVFDISGGSQRTRETGFYKLRGKARDRAASAALRQYRGNARQIESPAQQSRRKIPASSFWRAVDVPARRSDDGQTPRSRPAAQARMPRRFRLHRGEDRAIDGDVPRLQWIDC